eukprot:782798_1
MFDANQNLKDFVSTWIPPNLIDFIVSKHKEAIQTILNNVWMQCEANIKQQIPSGQRLSFAQNSGFQFIRKLREFKKRLHGRKCSHCDKKEMHNNRIHETFKKCKQCRMDWYCSVGCQKRDWNTNHRYYC